MITFDVISLFVIFSIVFFSFTYISLKKFCNSLFEINYITFWIIVYFVFFYIGAFSILLNLASDTYFVAPYKDNDSIKIFGAFLILYTGFSTFTYFFFFSILFRTQKRFRLYLQKEMFFSNDILFGVDASFVICILFFLYYQFSIFPSPLVMALSGSSPTDIAFRRIDVTKNLSDLANTYIISVLNLLVYFVSYAYVAIYACLKRRFFLSILSIFIALITFLSTGEKGPVLFYLLGIFVTYNLARGTSFKVSLKLVIFFVALLFIIYLSFMASDLSLLFTMMFDRIFIAQATMVYLSIEHYSAFGDIGFSSFKNIITTILDLQTYSKPASETLMEVYFYEMLGNGGWNINGLYIAESWSNFGFAGLILSPILVGLENAVVLWIICSLKKTPINCAVYSFSTISCVFFMTSFNSYMYSSIWPVFIVSFMIIYFCMSIRKLFMFFMVSK